MRKLWVRLTGAFLLVAVVALGVVAVVMGGAVERGFRRYIVSDAAEQVVTLLEASYARNGSWAGVEEVIDQRAGGRGMGQGQGQGQGAGAQAGRPHVTLYDADGDFVAGNAPERADRPADPDDLRRALPVTHEGATVGWLIVDQPGQAALNAAASAFLQGMRRTVVIAALIAGAVALLLGVGLSRVLVRPLRRLTEAAGAVARGELGREARVGGTAAEVTALADSFNSMSRALAEAEAQRSRLTADVAHELRTPISVMRGQLQAMLDGVYPTDAAHVAVVYEQTLHLARLVDDLHTLTRAESGHLPLERGAVDPASLARRAATLFEPLAADAGLALTLDAPGALPKIRADADRLHQVLANLLSNALRHTPPGGAIRLAVAHVDANVRFTVTNSGRTLTPEQAGRVFERFWRADAARQRDGGGAGLGLAIARQIVELHGGTIRVELGDDETRFVFDVPAMSTSGTAGKSVRL